MKIFKLLYSTLFNKCPRCHNGQVFTSNNPFVLSKMFSLHKNCSHCNLNFDPEPSFYYGAMYASYGLTAGWFIVWYFLNLWFLNIDALVFAIGITISIIVLSPLTLRLSRLLWLGMFNSFDKNFNKK